jgi:tetratricopeptide (TPR) repeat protein
MFRQFILFLALSSVACGNVTTSPVSAASASPQERAGRDAWLFRQGLAAAQRGDGVRAEQYLSLARERGYPADRVLPVLLKVCLASSRLRAALDYAEPYLRQHPDQDALRFLVANIHVGLGQHDEALSELDRLTNHDPRFDEAYFLRAGLLFEHDAPAAIEALRSYLDLAPRGVHAAEARGRVSDLLLKENAEAREVSPRSAEARP